MAFPSTNHAATLRRVIWKMPDLGQSKGFIANILIFIRQGAGWQGGVAARIVRKEGQKGVAGKS